MRNEEEYSLYNFERANVKSLFTQFELCQKECNDLLEYSNHLSLPAYDQCMKASHLFNLLDARGAISVSERQSYIGRIRDLAKACCRAYMKRNDI